MNICKVLKSNRGAAKENKAPNVNSSNYMQSTHSWQNKNKPQSSNQIPLATAPITNQAQSKQGKMGTAAMRSQSKDRRGTLPSGGIGGPKSKVNRPKSPQKEPNYSSFNLGGCFNTTDLISQTNTAPTPSSAVNKLKAAEAMNNQLK